MLNVNQNYNLWLNENIDPSRLALRRYARLPNHFNNPDVATDWRQETKASLSPAQDKTNL